MQSTEETFIRLSKIPDIDQLMFDGKHITDFSFCLEKEIEMAYKYNNDEAHLKLQRILYKINRLKLFWHDNPDNYINENSLFINFVRNKIEKSWQDWELSQIPINKIKETKDVISSLTEICTKDLEPKDPTPNQLYLQNEINIDGYKEILKNFSIDALVEASWLPWTIAGSTSTTQTVLSRIFIEEYGNGKIKFKHSTYFKEMLEEAGLNITPEFYLDSVTWEFLATVNQMFMLATWKQLYLRFIGAFLYMELNTPAAFKYYKAAADRLNINVSERSYWNIHIIEDQRHGDWMLNQAAIPVAKLYSDRAWEIIAGYQLQNLMSNRSGISLINRAKIN